VKSENSHLKLELVMSSDTFTDLSVQGSDELASEQLYRFCRKLILCQHCWRFGLLSIVVVSLISVC
jgi:hypothetical protein